MLAAIICKGNDNFISFWTPLSEVNVEEPVKFIARNDDMLPVIKNHEIISNILFPKKWKYNKIKPITSPKKSPFNENLLNGIQGSNIGVNAHPAKYAENKLINDLPPFSHARSMEYPWIFNPERIKNNAGIKSR